MPLSRQNSERTLGVTQLGYIAVGVSDLGAWREFATDVLGMQVNGEGPNGSLFVRMDSYHHRFELLPTGEDDLVRVGSEAKDAEAMRQIADQVRALGVDVEEASEDEARERMVLGYVRFKDPDGLATEVYYGPLLEKTRFVSPRGLGGFKAENLGLGHIVLAVNDVTESLRFYKDGLGVKISDFIEVARGALRSRVVFTHVNPRHHSLAMVQKAAAARPSDRRIAHFMVEVKSLDDVGSTIGLLQQRGVTPGQLGRHTNDHMVSFYAPTPSGFMVEFGYDGRTIDDEETWEIQHYRAASFWGHGMPPAPAAAPQPEPAKA